MTPFRIIRIAAALALPAAGGCAAPPALTPAGASRSLTIAAVSMESRLRDPAGNLARVEAWTGLAADGGAELVLFPEATLSGWWASREIRRWAETIDGPSIRRLIELAGRRGVALAVGMTERDGDRVYIAHVLLDGRGVIGVHRKTRLAPGEEQYWDPGDDARVFEYRGIRLGIAICYESIHPEMCARLRAAGAEIILAPYANGTDPDELTAGKRDYVYARARENGVWYVACDAPPRDERGRLGRGAVYFIDPSGRLLELTGVSAAGESMIIRTIRLPGAAPPRRPSTEEAS